MALKHAAPGDVVNLLDPDSAKTAALVKSDRFEAVRLVVPSGGAIPVHQVPGFITLLCLAGHAALDHEREVQLRAGDWIYLDRGAPHSVRGIEDSVLLLTILFD